MYLNTSSWILLSTTTQLRFQVCRLLRYYPPWQGIWRILGKQEKYELWTPDSFNFQYWIANCFTFYNIYSFKGHTCLPGTSCSCEYWQWWLMGPLFVPREKKKTVKISKLSISLICWYSGWYDLSLCNTPECHSLTILIGWRRLDNRQNDDVKFTARTGKKELKRSEIESVISLELKSHWHGENKRQKLSQPMEHRAVGANVNSRCFKDFKSCKFLNLYTKKKT